MKHLGDICKINGAEAAPVDVIIGGSPCQDLSVAGNRAGLGGARSGLFMEQIRIIKEMREVDERGGRTGVDVRPRWMVWENVPGAFSSKSGEDFRAVLEETAKIADETVAIPRPTGGKWNNAGTILGDGFSIAWRVMDAQYWGVPQRRRRIALVADFTGRRAGEILFKPDGLRGDLSQSDEAGQGAPADAVGGIDGGVGVEYIGFDMYNQASTGDVTRTVKTPVGGDDLPVVCVLNDQGGSSINVEQEEISPTLRANSHQHEPVIALQANGIDRADTAGCNGCGWRENESHTLNTVDRHAVCYPLNEQIILRHGALGRNTGFGAGEDGGPAYTLQANHPHAVCYDARNHNAQDVSGTIQAKSNGGQSLNYINPVCYDARGNGDGNLSPTITGDHQNKITDYTAVAVQEAICGVTSGAQFTGDFDSVAKTLRARDYKETQAVITKTNRRYIIRRLTPTECARLQGFPDTWGHLAPYDPADAEFWEEVRKTHAEINGKKYKPVKDVKKWYDKLHTDSAEYKMWGNGIALPNAEYVIRGIAEQGAKTLGSLFDGSGGFPLAGTMNGIKPLWASEIEPYPIAVTKSRFKEVQNG